MPRNRINNTSQQTQNVCVRFTQCLTDVEAVGPTLYKCFVFAGLSGEVGQSA